MSDIATGWPPVRGDRKTGNEQSHIAVVTLASSIDPSPQACIWGSCKTENLGAEKIVINTISNSNIRYLLLCGKESRGHLAGQTLISLYHNGVDGEGRIIGSNGAIPFIENITPGMIGRFQTQVELIDRIGLTDPGEIYAIVEQYADKGEVYTEAPFVMEASKKRDMGVVNVSADIIISGTVVMDCSSGVVCEECDL